MSGNWGIKADDGYVNFIHGTIDKVCDFETSSSIDDVCIFSEMVAKGYAQALNATAFRINISEQSQLTIPKSIADELDDIFNRFVIEQESCNIWTLLYRAEEQDFEIGVRLDKLLPDENQVNIAVAYLAGKALGVELVKVVEG